VAAPAAAWFLIGQGPGVDPADAAAQAAALERTPSHLVLANVTADHILRQMAQERREQRTVTVTRGDTLMALLQRSGVGRGEAFRAVRALSEVYSPRQLRPGQDIRLDLVHDPQVAGSGPQLAGLRLRASAERDVRVQRRSGGGFAAKALERALSREVAHAHGRIDSSLFADGAEAGVPAKIVLDLIHEYSYAVDFQRDLRKGDRFEVLHESFTEAGGRHAKTGALLYAALDVQGERLEMYRFKTADGDVGYYNGAGESMRRLLMRTPVDGARLSSGFGMRKHPIKGYTRMHEGVDFAAPTGTPIYAAGDGTVVRAGRNGGYGNYVEIRHANGYSTAYGHMHRIGKGIRRGARVEQGQVIGTVGNTGSSTGPHLHYEILVGGEPVNPQSLDLPTGHRLSGAELERFRTVKAEIDRLRQRKPASTRVAQAPPARKPGPAN
jgi:murein DD-endopeptidase MepM/ murein hydrolase activator NlpD